MRTSENITELVGAVFEASKELENPIAIADNPFYKSKYTPLDFLIKHIRKVISKHSLFIVQSADLVNNDVIVITRLFHSSGEWIETKTGVPAGIDAQKTGAAITYARRFALSAMFNIASDMDNDANETVDKINEMPHDVRQLFIDKGYKSRDAVKIACETCNYDWNLIRSNLKK
jgi:cupin superfamily acireductone dioxygenase involved in methionine salvage